MKVGNQNDCLILFKASRNPIKGWWCHPHEGKVIAVVAFDLQEVAHSSCSRWFFFLLISQTWETINIFSSAGLYHGWSVLMRAFAWTMGQQLKIVILPFFKTPTVSVNQGWSQYLHAILFHCQWNKSFISIAFLYWNNGQVHIPVIFIH